MRPQSQPENSHLEIIESWIQSSLQKKKGRKTGGRTHTIRMKEMSQKSQKIVTTAGVFRIFQSFFARCRTWNMGWKERLTIHSPEFGAKLALNSMLLIILFHVRSMTRRQVWSDTTNFVWVVQVVLVLCVLLEGLNELWAMMATDLFCIVVWIPCFLVVYFRKDEFLLIVSSLRTFPCSLCWSRSHRLALLSFVFYWSIFSVWYEPPWRWSKDMGVATQDGIGPPSPYCWWATLLCSLLQ